MKLRLNDAEEWHLRAIPFEKNLLGSGHPFHIHVNPFEVLTESCKWVCHDTFVVSQATAEKPVVRIRTRFTDFVGKAVFHCHILDHEDLGLMCDIVIDADEKMQSRVEPGVDDEPIATSFGISSSEGRRIVVFFRGIQCAHCLKELRSLLAFGDRLKRLRVSALAVSSEPIRDQIKARHLLGDPDESFC